MADTQCKNVSAFYFYKLFCFLLAAPRYILPITKAATSASIEANLITRTKSSTFDSYSSPQTKSITDSLIPIPPGAPGVTKPIIHANMKAPVRDISSGESAVPPKTRARDTK